MPTLRMLLIAANPTNTWLKELMPYLFIFTRETNDQQP